jgi:hypothetical protein
VDRRAGGAIDVFRLTADSADHMVMIITDAIFIQCSRTGWLYPPQQAFLDQQIERVVNGLTRNRSEFRANILGHIIRRAVRGIRHGAQNRQPLGSHLHPVISQ